MWCAVVAGPGLEAPEPGGCRGHAGAGGWKPMLGDESSDRRPFLMLRQGARAASQGVSLASFQDQPTDREDHGFRARGRGLPEAAQATAGVDPLEPAFAALVDGRP